MSITNSKSNYGSVAKWLHWSTAALFLGSYLSVYYRHWFTEAKTAENWTALQLHLSFGLSIGVISALRIIWRSVNTDPSLSLATKRQYKMAHIGHLLLYTVIILLVITGYLGTGVNTEFFYIFDVMKFSDTQVFKSVVEGMFGLSFVDFENPIDFIHKEILGAWLAWLLVVGHIAAALYHHYIEKDDTLRRMTLSTNSRS